MPATPPRRSGKALVGSNGFASLTGLRSLPASLDRLDRAFDRDSRVSGCNAGIVQAETQIAHGVKPSLIAECIASERRRDALRALGCRTGRGYRAGCPTSADEVAV